MKWITSNMQTLLNISKRIVAAFTFFTRLPLWRIVTVEKEYYERVVPLWPMAGWLTGGIMALVFLVATACSLPVSVAVVLSLLSRILLTGALHEDGFADFCDGFGGGSDRQSTLVIMKDSHIGTYGVLGLIVYFVLICCLLCNIANITQHSIPFFMIAADTSSKLLSSIIVDVLPYARTETESKNKLIYSRTPVWERIVSVFFGLIPLLFAACLYPLILICIVPSACCSLLLFLLMYKRLKGYTGDCCGACFIITEVVFYLSICIVI